MQILTSYLPVLVLACLIGINSACASDTVIGQDGSKTLSYTTTELLGEQQAAGFSKIIPTDKTITWSVYVPLNLTDKPASVLVYISPSNSGALDQRWKTILEKHNIIYIAAYGSGNKTRVNRRMVMALLALNVVEKLTTFDQTKVYISGFSGGGRVASKLAAQYPHIFSGALYICGVDEWDRKHKQKLDVIIKNRFVFLTGTNDFNRKETSKIYQRYINSGANDSKLILVPGMSHSLPDSASFSEALEFLIQDN